MPIPMLNLHFHGNGSEMTPSIGWIYVERILSPTNSYTRIGILVSKQMLIVLEHFLDTHLCSNHKVFNSVFNFKIPKKFSFVLFN